jgi:ABC-2 type transport system ATP-binding protein
MSSLTNNSLSNNSVNGEVVSLRNVSVRYHAHLGGRRSLKQLVVNLNRHNPQPVQEFWALRDIDLSLAHGEVLGVIGRNGAGKSTLLSVISRVLKPTGGTVCIRGSIAPLLSLGAGFDMELSGRENVYLLGALLGFSRSYTDDRYDEIVAFAELQDFIEAPLKTYSSGMMARLGFAIATSAEADLLLVDEVLAVGDERFRKKCEDRMRTFRDRHMTILLVSHAMPTVAEMSTRVVWLDRGRIAADGEPQSVIRTYQDFMARR